MGELYAVRTNIFLALQALLVSPDATDSYDGHMMGQTWVGYFLELSFLSTDFNSSYFCACLIWAIP